MSKTDMRDRLKELPFDYSVTKARKVMITFKNKQIMTLNEKESEKLMRKLENKSEFDVQLYLAKVTGNFKHGNEKDNKRNF